MKALRKAAVLLLAIVVIAGVCPMSASAQTVTYDKVLLETYTSSQATANTLPVVGQNVSDIVVKTSTTGVTVLGWELVGAGTKVENHDYILNVYIAMGVTNGVFDPYSTTAYINNVKSTITVNADRISATVSRQITPDVQAPVVWHHPSDETHNAGECFSFTATASQVYTSYQWKIRANSGETYNVEDIQSMFPGTYAVVSNLDQGTRCNIYNVPEGFNNWTVYCVFSGAGGDVSTNSATIHVKNASPDPTPTIVDAPSTQSSSSDVNVPAGITIVDEPTSDINIVDEPSDSQTADDTETTTNENINIVEWEDAWTYDDTGHWHKSIDAYSDEVSETEPHVLTWTTTIEATKKADGEEEGTCSVCGYTTKRNVAYEKPETRGLSTGAKVAIGVVGGIAVLGGGTVGVQYIIDSNKRKRRAKMSGRKYK